MNEMNFLRMCLPLGFLFLGVLFFWAMGVIDILTRKPSAKIGTQHTVNRISHKHGWLIKQTVFWAFIVLATGLVSLDEWIGASLALIIVLFHKKIARLMVYLGAKLAIFSWVIPILIAIVGLGIVLCLQNWKRY